MSSSSTRSIRMPDFEVLDTRRMPDFEVLDTMIALALNRIILKTQFKRKGQCGGTKSTKRGPFPSWKTDCLFDL